MLVGSSERVAWSGIVLYILLTFGINWGFWFGFARCRRAIDHSAVVGRDKAGHPPMQPASKMRRVGVSSMQDNSGDVTDFRVTSKDMSAH